MKIQRLAAWCNDVNAANDADKYSYLYIREEEFEKYQVGSFEELRNVFAK